MLPPDAGRRRHFGLDLLRALAMLSVLAGHGLWFFAPLFGLSPPGWLGLGALLGVELFFVLSGFLVGTLLLGILRDGPDLREWLVFLLRRWMRTLPLFWLSLLAIAVLLPPAGGWWAHLLRYASLTQNLWRRFPADDWFSPSWSLGVEEWFYLLFSAVLLGASRLAGPRRGLAATLALFLLLPPLARWWLQPGRDWFHGIHQVSLLRLDAIAYGVVLARLGPGSALARLWPLSLTTGLLLVAVEWVASFSALPGLDSRTVQLLFTPLVSIGTLLCVAAALRWRQASGWPARLVRALSERSYALYLLHEAVFSLATRAAWHGHIGPWTSLAASLAGLWLLSTLSLHLVERPLLRLRPAQGRKQAVLS